MLSLWETVKCKACGKEDQYDVSSGISAKVNGREDVEYTLIRCLECNEKMLLALGVVVTETYNKEDVEEAITKRSKEMIGYLGSKDELDKIKEIIRKREVIMTEEDRLLSEADADTVEYTGVFM